MAIASLQTLRFLLGHPLSAGRRVQALQRFARWQVSSRLSPGPIAVDFVGDARLLVRRGMTGATGNIYVGLHEFEDMAFLLHALRPEDLFVDIGANVGSYTVLAAKVVGARVVCFEPVATTQRALLDNLWLNGIAALVEARAQCVGREAGVLRMTATLDTTNRVLAATDAPSGADIEVPVVALDAALVGRTPFLVKIDVEGFESEVLAGARVCLSDPGVQCLIVETNSSGERLGRGDDELEHCIRSFGFAPYRYQPRTRRLEARQGRRAVTGNTLFVRDAELLRQRLASAPKFRVLGREL